jgi:hypothetical protein
MNGYYNSNPDIEHFYQGDILKDYPIIILPERNVTKIVYEGDEYSGTAMVQTKTFVTNIIIISQTCDIIHRDLVAICPVFPVDRLDASLQEQLKRGKINYRFWLPPITGVLTESYADFVIINTIKRQSLDINQRLASLSERYRSHLTDAIYHYFCRPVTIE